MKGRPEWDASPINQWLSRLTSQSIEVCLGILLQVAAFLFKPMRSVAWYLRWIRWYPEEQDAIYHGYRNKYAHSVSPLLLGELSVNGPFYLTRLLHDSRPHSGRRFLKPTSSVSCTTPIEQRQKLEGEAERRLRDYWAAERTLPCHVSSSCSAAPKTDLTKTYRSDSLAVRGM